MARFARRLPCSLARAGKNVWLSRAEKRNGNKGDHASSLCKEINNNLKTDNVITAILTKGAVKQCCE